MGETGDRKEWPARWAFDPGGDGRIMELPLVVSPEGFGIYSLDLMGRALWNGVCARALAARLAAAGITFDIILTAEAKAIGLAERFAGQRGHDEYVVMRKSLKLYMRDPVELEVRSITTPYPQKFYISAQSRELLRGRRVLALDDVLSTGGTMRAFSELARRVGFELAAIAVVLTEGKEWTEFDGVPVVSLGHIPLPGNMGRV